MFRRRISTFGPRNLKTLRAFADVNSIRELRNRFTGKTDDEIYSELASQYNTIIANRQYDRKQNKKEESRLATSFKNLPIESSSRTPREDRQYNFYINNANPVQLIQDIPVQQSSKKSREERIRGKMSKEIDNQRNITVKQKERFNRRALGNTFEDIEYKNVRLDEINGLIYDTILERYSRSDKTYHVNVNLYIKFTMAKKQKDDKPEITDFGYNSKKVERIISPNQIKQWVAEEIELFNERLTEYGASGYTLVGIKLLSVQFSETRRVRGGSFIELPDWVKLKRCCVNIKNKDDKCIVWSLLAYKYYDTLTRKDKNEVSVYKPYENEIVVPKDVIYPIDVLKDIPKFEKLNNMKINVFRLDGKFLQTMYNTKDRNSNVVNLLLLESSTTNHFVWIKDLAKLACQNKNKAKSYFCSQCLSASFTTQEALDSHLKLCYDLEAVRAVLPTDKNNILKFKNYGNMFPHPFAVFLDFESTLSKYDDEDGYKQQIHNCNSVGYKYNCIYDEYSEPLQLINSPNPDNMLEKLINDLERLAIKSYKLTKQYPYYNCSRDDRQKLIKSKTCEYCKCQYDDKNKACIHHDHITGKYIATICSKCNLEHTYKRFLPVYIHNLKGYDSHFIVPALNKFGLKAEINCIPNNEERYISFSKTIVVDEYSDKKGQEKSITYEIRFLDTFAFMSSSLDALSTNLKKGCNNNVAELRKTFRNVSNQFADDSVFLMMIEKGVYPYEYIDTYDKLNETSLPFIDKFYSKLTLQHIHYKDYLKALKVWKRVKCNTMLDYHNLYLTSDVLILADVWENFKNVCMKIYNLDVSYYYTAPGLSWDAFLKHTQEECKLKSNEDFEIELLTDMDMYQFVENNIRGGLSQISKRYAKANHKELSTYNKNAIDEYILYLDANNLYGYAMSQYLPQKNFKWNTEEWTPDRILAIPDDSKTGYMFDVDLHYPVELHDIHNGYALAPENIIVKNDMLNGWQSENRKETKVMKLVTSFHDKKEYGLNYRLLKLYLKLGLKITKINRVLQFTQSNFMESYIMKNTNERVKAKNDFEKDFYKLMNNSVYGKTMENVRNRINFSIVSDEVTARNYQNIMKKRTIFNDNCVGIHLLKKEVKLMKPIFIGQTVLDESKYLMNDFHYNFMLKKFERRNIDLLFTDTDSLCYHIKRQNPYDIIAANKDRFDLASYPKSHPLYNPTNKKVIGKFKDESVDGSVTHITEFVGLRSKLYSYTTEEAGTNNIEEHHKCKGVKKAVINNEMTTELYKSTLFSRQQYKVKQSGFRSYKHQLYTEEIPKVALSGNDDKVYICDNNITTYTIGHYRTRKQN